MMLKVQQDEQLYTVNIPTKFQVQLTIRRLLLRRLMTFDFRRWLLS